jgi:hypothetical protein
MNVPPNELLRMLAGGISPVARSPSVRFDDGASLDFRAMLEKATRGNLTTGLPVRIPSGLSPPVSLAEHDSLSLAADRAQAAGIERALVDLGGRTLRMDVQERQVIDAPDAQLRAVGGIDGYVRGMSDARERPDLGISGTALGPARIVRNQSLIDALARVLPGVG